MEADNSSDEDKDSVKSLPVADVNRVKSELVPPTGRAAIPPELRDVRVGGTYEHQQENIRSDMAPVGRQPGGVQLAS